MPGELSRDNILSTERSPFLWLDNIRRLSQPKRNGLYFISVHIVKRTLHGRLEIRTFSSLASLCMCFYLKQKYREIQHATNLSFNSLITVTVFHVAFHRKRFIIPDSVSISCPFYIQFQLFVDSTSFSPQTGAKKPCPRGQSGLFPNCTGKYLNEVQTV